MLIYIYDKTFAGVLTALFDVYNRREFPTMLLEEGAVLPLFFDQLHRVYTDMEKANRVWRGLCGKLSPIALAALKGCWMSELPEAPMLLLRYMKKTFDASVSIELNFGDEDVLAVTKIYRQVCQERLRILQFLRFQKTIDGLYFAPIKPKFNVLPLTVAHFKDRFADQKWLIYDFRRQYGYYYDLNRVDEVTFNENEEQLLSGVLDDSLLVHDEQLFQQLWKTYFKATAIQERRNPRKQRQDMPMRFWEFLTEKQ